MSEGVGVAGLFDKITESIIDPFFRFPKRKIFLIPLLGIPAWFTVAKELFGFPNLRTVYLSPIFFVPAVASISLSTVAYIILILRKPPKNTFTVAIARFHAVSTKATDDVADMGDRFIQNLHARMKAVPELDTKLIKNAINLRDKEDEQFARQLARHSRAHVIVCGSVRVINDEWMFQPTVIATATPAYTFARDPDIKPIMAATPATVQLREQKVSEIGDLVLVICGIAALYDKRYEASIAALSAVVEHTPETHFYRGYSYLKAGRPAEALRCFDEATLMKPEFYYGWLFRAIALHRTGDLDGSRRYLSLVDKFAACFLPSTSAELILSNTIFQDPVLHTVAVKSIQAIQQVPRRQKSNQNGVQLHLALSVNIVAHASYLLGQDYVNEKRYPAAVERFNIALRAQPGYLLPLCAKGIALARAGDAAGARRTIASILPLIGPELPVQLRAFTEYQVASISGVIGDATMATRHLGQVIATHPQFKSVMRTSPDFDSVRSDKEFQRITTA